MLDTSCIQSNTAIVPGPDIHFYKLPVLDPSTDCKEVNKHHSNFVNTVNCSFISLNICISINRVIER